MECCRWHQLLRILGACFALLSGVAAAGAQDISAAFTSSRVAPGETVQFQISISGLRQGVQPPEISVEGLDVQYLGPSQSTQTRIENGRITASSMLTHIYQVTPRRAGTFTIPALEVEADGKRFRTQPVTLRVEKESAGGGSSSGGSVERLAFAQFVVPKETLYVGEAMPVELRLYIDAGARAQIEAMPIIGGEGFTKTKLTEPRQERARKDGREYDVYVFRTAITPSRAGKVTFGPSEITFQAQLRPQQRRRDRPRSLLEEMLGSDPFDSFDPFSAPTRVQRVTAKADAVTLDVKPLPSADRPKNFSGAVGQFKLSAEGSPHRIKIGDVLTMKLAVSGRGGFDRVNAPEIVESSGWRLYPATGQFKGEDELGISGIKTFEVPVIPEVKKSEMPRYEFSYFDSTTDKYVTVTAGGGPLEVSGTTTPVLAPGAPSTPQPKAEPREESTKSAPAKPADILGLRYDRGRSRSFVPLHERRTFWLAQLVPLVTLLAWLLLRMRRNDATTARLARLRRERAEVWRTLRRSGSDAEFLEAATRVVKIDTALATGCPEHTVDATQARASRSLDPGTAEAIEDLFNARAELLYAGTGGRGDALSAADRARFLSALDTFEKSDARD